MILIIVAVYFVVRLVGNLMKANERAKHANRKMAEELARERQRTAHERANDRQRRTVRDDGRTRVEYVKGNDKSNKQDFDDGEYVDFEEVD